METRGAGGSHPPPCFQSSAARSRFTHLWRTRSRRKLNSQQLFYFECSWWTQLGLSLYMNLKLSLTRRNWWRLLYLYVVAWIYEKWGYFCTLAALKLALLPEYNCQNKTPLVAAISGLYLVIGGQMASCLAGTGAITAWSHRSPPWCAYPRQ